ncbi:ribonuclease H-like domain-containing protein [Natrarchaeobaculum sulfurireducens]|uniref:Putative DNA repair and recombination protein radA n=1 Tax=Natrarchaeobaculum sulfurireducens TaxID=2044521 RepID=A0A346PQ95_9EURY|nr:ribonuclease H-like domain-containing protein [Natrarchaeobaculum sulfurireducens]AXR81690.1 putative DNA repair and recombination protein radA [Natrarchaeobaculum sulfurireducens]
MTARAGPGLLALSPSVLADRPEATLQDMAATLEPDAVWVLGPSRDARAFARARRAFDVPVVHPPLESGDGPLSTLAVDTTGRTLEVAFAPDARALQRDPETAAKELTASKPCALVCDDVTTSVRPTALETTLEYADALASALPRGRVSTVLTGGEPAGYDELWHLEPATGAVRAVDHDPLVGSDSTDDEAVSIRVRGAGSVESYGKSTGVALVTLDGDGDGVERTDTHDVTDFGLEAVSGIGPKTAARLADRGIQTRADVLETSMATLADLPGVGRDRARTFHQHATVLETGEPRRLTDESLPGENWSTPPLCLDIETDGLSPTIIWQVGVYDPVTDEYRAFVERTDPTDPAPVLEAFCDWLFGIHPNRALLTWNGWRFDYRHLGAFIAKHVPYYAEEWEAIPTFDLYLWAVGNDNALLPGRTNALEDVASALDYEGAGTGLDGARTAAAYQRFVRTGEPLEWDRHEAYCEDDCRALWHVYEHLRDAPQADSTAETTASDRSSTSSVGLTDAAESDSSGRRREPTSGETKNSTERTEQTGLGDF